MSLFATNYVSESKEEVISLVYSITVRSRGLRGNIVACLRTIGGGEIHESWRTRPGSRRTAG